MTLERRKFVPLSMGGGSLAMPRSVIPKLCPPTYIIPSAMASKFQPDAEFPALTCIESYYIPRHALLRTYLERKWRSSAQIGLSLDRFVRTSHELGPLRTHEVYRLALSSRKSSDDIAWSMCCCR